VVASILLALFLIVGCYVSQLKQEKRFIEACELYGFPVFERIAIILGCHKIGKEQSVSENIVEDKNKATTTNN
jgi:hypothetical protein